jgi:hypothetical protein
MFRIVRWSALLLCGVALALFAAAPGSADDKGKGKGKDKGKKSNIVEVDLSQLPKELAKELKAYLKGGDKKDAKSMDDKKGKGKGDDKGKGEKGKGEKGKGEKGKGEKGKGEKVPATPSFSSKEIERRLDQLGRELDELRALIRGKKK